MTYRVGPELTRSQRQVLYGTLLGGSTLQKPKLGKNCYLSMRDSNLKWLAYKTQELRDLYKMDQNVIKADNHTYRCASVAFPAFMEIYPLFYQNGLKVINKEVLEYLNDIAWMVWFFDAATIRTSKTHLRTSKFGQKGTEMVHEYFTSLDVECSVYKHKNKYEISFSKNGNEQLLNTFKNKVPVFMIDTYRKFT